MTIELALMVVAPIVGMLLISRWLRGRWRAFRRWRNRNIEIWWLAVSPFMLARWLWRKVMLLGVPGWLSDADFYQTVEWRMVAAKNKRDYGSRCIICTVSNAELPSGTALHSHHVKKRLTHPWMALSQSNLAPVCPTCHRDVEAGRIKLRWTGKRWAGVAA